MFMKDLASNKIKYLLLLLWLLLLL